MYKCDALGAIIDAVDTGQIAPNEGSALASLASWRMTKGNLEEYLI
jgi:hypothetical protein